MNSRSEPLLWLQLIGLGVLPLQALLLLLLLAGSDPGRLPALERLLTWAIGALLPGVLLARRPADPFSLLLVTTPLRGRRDLQRRLSSLQDGLPLRLGLAIGIAGALPLLVWCDEHAALAAALSPLAGGPRLLALLLVALLLALMVWQWQQLLQASWLLSRSSAALAATDPLSQAAIEERRLCLGLPLLLPEPLQGLPAPAPAPASRPVETTPDAEPALEQMAAAPDVEPAPLQPPSGAVAPLADQPPAAQVGPQTDPDPDPESGSDAEVEADAES